MDTLLVIEERDLDEAIFARARRFGYRPERHCVVGQALMRHGIEPVVVGSDGCVWLQPDVLRPEDISLGEDVVDLILDYDARRYNHLRAKLPRTIRYTPNQEVD